MIYTSEEKQQLDNILTAFHSYIEEHPVFDILYSKKIGYIRVQADNPDYEGVTVIRSVDTLLDVLYNEIIDDIIFDEEHERQSSSPELTEEETEEVRQRIMEMIQAVRPEEDAKYCADFLDEYLENYPDNDIEDSTHFPILM